ncbi:MAG: acyl-CoA dehydrogenase [Alphaproteobacteria bacterium]|jgi:alkylation response protein AidB-like acyl-CoA dehydrogenase
MDFSLSDDQRLLKESVEQYITRDYPFEKRRAHAALGDGFSREAWAAMATLGWPGAALPVAYGGSGGGAVETMLMMEELGRGLVVEPLLATAILGGGLILGGGTETQKADLLPTLIEGRLLLAFAYTERQSRHDLHHVELTAVKHGAGYRLNGQKSVVLNGDSADMIIVSGRTGGDVRDRSGISLFLVDAASAGLGLRGYATMDGMRAAEINFDQAEATLISEADGALPLIEQTIDQAAVAVMAEALGIMAVINDLTLEYLKTREQFGQPIGKFQALQHRMVDMVIAAEESRSLVMVAAMQADGEANVRARAVSAAKVQIARAGRLIGQEAVQLHGAIAMTDDYQLGHYFKRLTMIGQLFGDSDHHLRRFAQLNG